MSKNETILPSIVKYSEDESTTKIQ